MHLKGKKFTTPAPKVKYLAAEEVIKLRPGTRTAIQIGRRYLNSVSSSNPFDSGISQKSHARTKPRARSLLLTKNANIRPPAPRHSTSKLQCLQQEDLVPEKGIVRIDGSPGPSRPSNNTLICFPGKEIVPIDGPTQPSRSSGSNNSLICSPGKEFVPTDGSPQPSRHGGSNNTLICSPAKEIVSINGSAPNSRPSNNELISPPGREIVHTDGSAQPSIPSHSHDTLICFAGGDPRNPKSQEQISSKIVSNCTTGPALERIWKGSFEVLGISTLRGLSLGMKFCEGLSSHPAATVSRKAYDFTKQIANVILFSLYPRCDVWHTMFKTDTPDANDIALYFYSSDASSHDKYSFLLRYIDDNDLLMSSRIGPVELTVFSSKLLPAGFQTLEGSFFLWGVYRSLKNIYPLPHLPAPHYAPCTTAHYVQTRNYKQGNYNHQSRTRNYNHQPWSRNYDHKPWRNYIDRRN